jgi:hypothetical protein
MIRELVSLKLAAVVWFLEVLQEQARLNLAWRVFDGVPDCEQDFQKQNLLCIQALK